MFRSTFNLACTAVGCVLIFALSGCQTGAQYNPARDAYYDYDFAQSCTILREEIMGSDDEQVILNNLRLGMAALAEGDWEQADRALNHSFHWLSTPGLNDDRNTAAVLTHEGVRIWKGEPFEQALGYHYVATLHAINNDWENARAAAANSIMRLSDFQEGPQSYSNNNPATNFTLGLLMQAIASDHASLADSTPLYEAALKNDTELRSIIDALRQRRYNTILLLDFGKGPSKKSFGPDNAHAEFINQSNQQHAARITINKQQSIRALPVCNVNELADEYTWNRFEEIRQTKSAIGQTLFLSGAILAGASDDDSTLWAGVGMMLAGLFSRATSSADLRYLDYAPQLIYLIPLELDQISDLSAHIEHVPNATIQLPAITPGTTDQPRVIYLRLYHHAGPQPAWLTTHNMNHETQGNDHTMTRVSENTPPGDSP